MKTTNHFDLKLQQLSFQQNFLNSQIPRFIFECSEYQPKITGNHTTSPQYTSAQSVCDTLLSEPYYKTDYNNYYQSDYYHYQQLRWEISAFSLLSFCQMRDSSAFSVCILFEESVFIFQFLNAQLCQTKHNCEFHHSKIEKQTHFPQKVYKLRKLRTQPFQFVYFLKKMCFFFNF